MEKDFEISKDYTFDSFPYPSPSTITKIIENGMSNESNEIREKSFRLFQYLYIERDQAIRWEGDYGVKASILTELKMASLESKFPLTAAIALLSSVNDEELVLLLCSKEGSAAFKSCCTTPNMEVRKIAISGLSPLIVRVWVSIMSENYCNINNSIGISLEACMHFDSPSDSRRAQEDFAEFAIDLFKSFANVLASVEDPNYDPTDPNSLLISDISMVDIYCDAITVVFDYYIKGFDNVNEWIRCLLASSNINKLPNKSYCSSIISLLQPIFYILFNDPYLLITRWKESSSYTTSLTNKGQNSFSRLISVMLFTLLQEMPEGSSLDTILDLNKQEASIFGVIETDPTKSSRSGGSGQLHVVRFATEWISTCLLYELASPSIETTLAAITKVINLLQNDCMKVTRIEISPFVVLNIFRILNICDTLKKSGKNECIISDLEYDELLAKALLMMRYLPCNQLCSSFISLCNYIVNIVDVVSSKRILTEAIMLLLLWPLNNGYSYQLVTNVLNNSWLNNILSLEVEPKQQSIPNLYFQSNFLTSICRCLCRILPVSASSFLSKSSKISTGIGIWSTLSDINISNEDNIQEKLVSFESFVNSLSTSILIAKEFSCCLQWNFVTDCGDVSILSYITLISEISSILLPNNGEKCVLYKDLNENQLSQIDSLKNMFVESIDDIYSFHLVETTLTSSNGKFQLITFLIKNILLLRSNEDDEETQSESIISNSNVILSVLKSELTNNKQAYFASLDLSREIALNNTAILGDGGKHDDNSLSSYSHRLIEILQCIEKLSIITRNEDICKLCLDFLQEIFSEIIIDSKRYFSSVLYERIILSSNRIISSSPSSFNLPILKSQSNCANENKEINKKNSIKDYSFDFENDILDNLENLAPIVLPTTTSKISLSDNQSGLLFNLSSISSYPEAKDIGFEYSLFSRDGLNRGLNLDHINVFKRSSSDIIGVMDDIITGHINTPWTCRNIIHSNTQSDVISNEIKDMIPDYDISQVLGNENDAFWQTISSSSDILTILAFVDCNEDTDILTLRVKIINSSGFKIIPLFELSLLFSFDGFDEDFPFDVTDGLNQAYGCKHEMPFLPNEIVERIFKIPLKIFKPMSIIVRMKYPELAIEEGIDMFSSVITSSNNISGETHLHHEKKKNSNRATILTAEIDCSPIHVGVCYMLQPYGAGVFNSMSSWLLLDNVGKDLPGIPLSVFRSQWDRLIGNQDNIWIMYSSSIFDYNEEFQNLTIAEIVTSVVISLQHYHCNKGAPFIGMNARVQIDDDNIDEKKNSSILAWSLQSLWGNEIAVRLIIDDTNDSESKCGRLEIRASDLNTLRSGRFEYFVI
jgi:hypothetical protein